ncbi:MAG TPA: hypothetical protein VFM37_11975 [Pseudonocardiaceae bacterium]|nr:hypothetical protein [Pseudonocardiaceae bacterium]
MDDNLNTNAYLAFLILGTGLTLLVGQLLIRSGRPYLEEVFGDSKVAGSVTRLLAVLFHLFVLGVLLLISTVDVPVEGALQAVITKLGVVLLILGVAQGGTMLVLSKLRERRLAQELMLGGAPNATPNDPLGPPEVATIHADGVVIRPAGGTA